MVKPKSPLLSLGARGTIADTLTFQKRGRDTIAREKPTPRDPYSLPQAYQRWLYRDYAYLWTLQTNSQKQVYRTRASRYHITGFSLWMREHLRDLPDIAAMWHLDEKAEAVAYDSSRNSNHGTIFGATPADGLIDGAQSFDGVNDYINLANPPTLQVNYPVTWEAFIKPTSTQQQGRGGIFGLINGLLNNHILVYNNGRLRYEAKHDTAGKFYDGPWCTIDAPNHFALTYTGTQMVFWLNGAPYTPKAITGNIDQGALSQRLGWGSKWADYYHLDGLIDHAIIYTRILDETEIKRHSLRRYPA